MSSNKQIADTILAQLGGNKFIAMTGAKQFGFSSEGPAYLSFKIGKNSTRCNFVKIEYKSDDTYTMTFLYVTVKNIKELSKHEGLYNDMLRSVFTRETGMYTSLAG